MSKPLAWHYGPNGYGKRLHDNCEGEIRYLFGGDICLRCQRQHNYTSSVNVPHNLLGKWYH